MAGEWKGREGGTEVGEGERTQKTSAHGGGVLADAAEGLNPELGALQLADFEVGEGRLRG